LEHTTEQVDGVTVITLQGSIDVSQAIELRELLGDRISGAAARVLLDLTNVRLIDSSGIGILVTAHRRAADASAGFALANPSEAVGKVLTMTRTDRLLNVYDSVAEGVAGLSGAAP
jgi:anti-anti-sigma factor